RDDAPFFKAAYDVTTAGNWEGHTILNRTNDPDLKRPKDEAALEQARAKLFLAREKRVRPGWDDKVLADWNGLMIAAIARAGWVFDEPQWTNAALAAYDFVRTTMGADGRLRHSARHGRATTPGTLDDYAAMARAALVLYETQGTDRFLADAR